MTTAYEIIIQAQTLAGQGAAGFDDDEQYAAWEASLGELGVSAADKLAARRHVETSLRVLAASLKSTAAAIADRAKRLEANADRLDEGTLALLRSVVEATGKPRVDTVDGGWAKLSVRTSRAVVIHDDTAIPSEFSRVKIEPDKVRIKSAIDSGRVVPGAYIEERTSESVQWGK